MSRISNRLLFSSKIVIGVFLFVVVLRWIDFSALKDVQLSLIWFIPIVFLTVFVMVLKVLRWRSILETSFGHTLPLWDGLAIMLIGQLFGFVSPARAGDFIRAGYVRKSLGLKKAASSVVIDMLWDLLIMIVLSLLAILWFGPELLDMLRFPPIELGTFYAFFFVGIGVLISLFWIMVRHAPKLFAMMGPFGRKLADATSVLSSTFSVGSVFYQGGLSLLNWIATGLASYFAILALGLQAKVIPVLLIMSLQSLLMLLPVTVSGLGLREGTSFILYPLIAIPADLAVPVVWLGTFFLSVIPALFGGGLYLWYREIVPGSNEG